MKSEYPNHKPGEHFSIDVPFREEDLLQKNFKHIVDMTLDYNLAELRLKNYFVLRIEEVEACDVERYELLVGLKFRIHCIKLRSPVIQMKNRKPCRLGVMN